MAYQTHLGVQDEIGASERIDCADSIGANSASCIVAATSPEVPVLRRTTNRVNQAGSIPKAWRAVHGHPANFLAWHEPIVAAAARADV